MRVVVSDTSPLNYLAQLDVIWILKSLFETVLIPSTVIQELSHPRAPMPVRNLVIPSPEWIRVVPAPLLSIDRPVLGPGETAAIALALEQKPSLLLIDDKRGMKLATELGVPTLGTLGILEQAASAGLLELSPILAQLLKTNFRCSPAVVRNLLDRLSA